MDGGHVQRIFAIANAQESGRLLERLGADARHILQLSARAEASVFIAILHDVDARCVR